jgi:hypothetical protein
MSRQTTVYNAFTGMNPSEMGTLIRFLCSNGVGTSPRDVQEALDYALKHKPSFGGFVVAIKDNQRFLAAIVVNRTGMEGYSSNNICVFVGIDKSSEQQEEMLQQLMQKAISYANGDLAMHIEPDHPALQLYQQMGFRAKYLELRIEKPLAATA